jgi:small conductance mechanosensitive channel
MTIDPSIFLAGLFWFLVRVAGAALTLLVTRRVANRTRLQIRPVLVRAKLTPSMIVLTSTVAYYTVWLVGIMIAMVVFGVPLDTVFLIVVAALVVLGIALQESLRDLAATVNFILFKHFEPGDLIETNGILGTVQEIELLNTSILCADRRVAVLPNGKIQQEGLLNYSKEGILRVDMVYTISYEDDLEQAKEVIRQLLSEDARVLDEPEPLIVVLDLGDNGVDIGVRPFVKAEDHWQVLWDTTEAIKLRFDRERITIPYPQREVQMKPAPGES